MRCIRIALSVLPLVLVMTARAQGVPFAINSSGYLLDASDQPVSQQGVALGFSVWSDPSSPLSRIWPATGESPCLADVSKGFYTITLDGSLASGCGAGLNSDHVPGGQLRYLQVSVGGMTLSPRMRIGTVPTAAFATQSADAQALATALSAAGMINTDTNPVDWSQLKNVPAAFSDGTDDGNSYTAAVGGGLELTTGAFSITAGGVTNAMLASDGASLARVSGGLALVSGTNVGIGTASPGAKLEVAGTIKSTTGGFVFPDGTVQTTAANTGGSLAGTALVLTGASSSPVSAVDGTVYYSSTNGTLYVRSGGAWVAMAGGSLGTATNPATDCLAIKQADPSASSAVYWVNPGAPLQVWCEMSFAGGGWTLVGSFPSYAATTYSTLSYVQAIASGVFPTSDTPASPVFVNPTKQALIPHDEVLIRSSLNNNYVRIAKGADFWQASFLGLGGTYLSNVDFPVIEASWGSNNLAAHANWCGATGCSEFITTAAADGGGSGCANLRIPIDNTCSSATNRFYVRRNVTPAAGGALGTQGNPAASCNAIKTANNLAQSGAYWLNPSSPFQAWCEMTFANGGWTLVGMFTPYAQATYNTLTYMQLIGSGVFPTSENPPGPVFVNPTTQALVPSTEVLIRSSYNNNYLRVPKTSDLWAASFLGTGGTYLSNADFPVTEASWGSPTGKALAWWCVDVGCNEDISTATTEGGTSGCQSLRIPIDNACTSAATNRLYIR